MKNILTLFTLTFLSLTTIYGQNNSTKKADKHFSRLEFVKAAEEYLELINKGNSGDYVISQLAESYYNIFNTVGAEKWYSKIADSSSDPEVIYKYAQMLKANGKYKLSNEWMIKFTDLRPYDNRSTSFLKDPNYLSKIINKGKRFNVQNLDINSEYSDFGGVLFEDQIYITSARNDKRKIYGWNDEPFLDVYKFNVDEGSYINEEILDDVINTKYHEGIVAFSPDGSTIYFTRESFFDKSFYRDSLTNNQIGVIHLYKATRCVKKHITWNNGNVNFHTHGVMLHV